MIRLAHITKTFPGVKALDDVSLEVVPGEVHALCGENGAGKSTLMNVLSGIWPYGSYTGRILQSTENAGDHERELRFHTVNDATNAGVAIVHQELALMPEMTVLDNLFLGRERNCGGRLDKRGQTLAAKEHLGALGFAPPLDAYVKTLTVGQQQRLEIARALLGKPTVLVLDEPTSALPKDDAANLLTWIRRLADAGTACIYISHRMNEVFRIADRITVLRDGRSVWTQPTGTVDVNTVIQAMVDRPPTDMYAHTPVAAGDVICRVQNLRVERAHRCILELDELEVRRGEIVGLAGMMGAGRTCLLRALTGSLRHARVRGTFTGPDNETGPLPNHPAAAMRRGLFLIPEDRKQQALFLDQSIAVNTTAANVSRFRRRGHIDRRAMREATQNRMTQFDIHTIFFRIH